MNGALALELDPNPIARARADVAIVGLFVDEVPLRGAAGAADWRLCGRLSELVAAGRLRGAPGEAALLSTDGGLRAPLLVALGLGSRAEFDAARCRVAAADACRRGLDLRAASIALSLSETDESRGAADRAQAVLGGACEALAERRAELRLRLLVAPAGLPSIEESLRRSRTEASAAGVSVRLGAPLRPRSGAARVRHPGSQANPSLPVK